MIFLYEKIFLRGRAELGDSLSLLALVVKISQIWPHLYELTLMYFTSWKKKTYFYDYMYTFTLTTNV